MPPLPPGSGYAEIAREMDLRLEGKVREFRPELVLISAGFDGRVGDPIGDFTLSDKEFALLTRRVMGWAETYAGGRLVSVLEGGYNLGTLGGAVAAHVGELVKRGQKAGKGVKKRRAGRIGGGQAEA